MEEQYLALDIGEKRIGVAVGSTIAFGRGVIDGTDIEAAAAKIRAIIEAEKINKLIVGLPKVRSGEVTASQNIVYAWVDRLKTMTDLPIVLVDEAFSSQEAESQLRAQQIDTKHDKWRVDERAAQIILQQYLHETSSS